MDPDFWLQRWQNNEIGFHQHEINTHLKQFWSKLGLPANGRVFVPLCGKSRDMLWLASQGNAVLGVEISPVAVLAFFDENSLPKEQIPENDFIRWRCDTVDILCGDFFALQQSELAEVVGVYDRASLIALPPPLRKRYARHLISILPADARILLVTMEYSESEMAGPPFPVAEQEVRDLYQSVYNIDVVYKQDILEENPRFKNKGLTGLVEKVYVLSPKN
jgi:thiopurine S-methyltransferase